MWLVAAGALCACRDASKTRDNDGDRGVLHMVIPKTIEEVDPRHLRDAYALKLSRLIFASLVTIDPDTLELVPQLAREIHIVSDTEYEVHLNHDLHFSDGSVLDAKDVKATFMALKDASIGSRFRPYYDPIDRIDIISPSTVRFTLHRPHSSFIGDLEFPILRAEDAFVAGSLMPKGLIGAGDFKVRAHDSDRWVLEPVSAKGLSVSIETVNDENTRMLRFLSQRADIGLNVFSPLSLQRLNRARGLTVLSQRSAGTNYLGFQTEGRWLRHLEIRKAIAYAIDTETIIRYKLGGRAQKADSLVPEGHWAFHKASTQFDYDPQRARELLSNFCNRYHIRPGSIRLTLKTSTDRQRLSIAQVIAKMLKDVGLNVEVTPREFGTLMEDLTTGRFDLVGLQIPDLIEPNFLEYFFASDNIPGATLKDGSTSSGANRWRYRSAEVDQLLSAGLNTTDTSERKRVYASLQERLMHDLPVFPLWHEDNVAVVSRRGANFKVPRDGRWAHLIKAVTSQVPDSKQSDD